MMSLMHPVGLLGSCPDGPANFVILLPQRVSVEVSPDPQLVSCHEQSDKPEAWHNLAMLDSGAWSSLALIT